MLVYYKNKTYYNPQYLVLSAIESKIFEANEYISNLKLYDETYYNLIFLHKRPNY